MPFKNQTCCICGEQYPTEGRAIVRCAFCGKFICDRCADRQETKYPTLPIMCTSCENEISISCEEKKDQPLT